LAPARGVAAVTAGPAINSLQETAGHESAVSNANELELPVFLSNVAAASGRQKQN
jgi:hypothetical protein